jgi:NRAMP (natural resistance-associated macrophage protein)-like metal ion transporter
LDSIAAEVAGPGIITGAADDDPSGIATYSVAGAQLGTKLLWTALVTWPLMAAVQMMCARIGKVTGQGLAANFKQRFPKWLLLIFVMALLAANTINIAADLAGMADAAAMLSGGEFPLVCDDVCAAHIVGNSAAQI